MGLSEVARIVEALLFLATEPVAKPARWGPSPEEEADLRDRLLRAGEARAGVLGPPSQPGGAPAAEELPAPA